MNRKPQSQQNTEFTEIYIYEAECDTQQYRFCNQIVLVFSQISSRRNKISVWDFKCYIKQSCFSSSSSSFDLVLSCYCWCIWCLVFGSCNEFQNQNE